MKINIKPLSVNQCWQGRRFKTDKYRAYEAEMLYRLPKMIIPKVKLNICITVGFSNKASDIDNVAKPFIDILQKKYSFNDNQIYLLTMTKKIVKKGNEYIDFSIEVI